MYQPLGKVFIMLFLLVLGYLLPIWKTSVHVFGLVYVKEVLELVRLNCKAN